MVQTSAIRRPRAYLSEFNITQLHLSNPWIVAFWSFAFPGCGNLLQGRKLKGMFLIIWELVINTNAKINLSIMYSLLGQFDKAREVVDTRWFLLYVALYVYSMWDSYRGTVDLNKLYILADREDAPVLPFTIKTLDLNYLDKRNPWVALAFTLLMPGLGHLYIHRVIIGIFMIIWTIVVGYFSNCFPAIHYTMTGDFLQAKTALDMQWFMYIPSIYGFVLHDSYASAVEYNKLFEKEQSRFFRDHFQNTSFKMPL